MTIHSWQFLEQSQFAIHVSKDAVLNNPYDGNDLSCTTAALWVGHLSHTGPLPFGISKPRLSQTRRCCPIKKGHTWLITCTTSCRESQYRVVMPDHRFYTNSCFLVPNWQTFQQSCAQQEASEMERLLQTGQFLRAAVTFEEGVHSKMEAAEDSLFVFCQ